MVVDGTDICASCYSICPVCMWVIVRIVVCRCRMCVVVVTSNMYVRYI